MRRGCTGQHLWGLLVGVTRGGVKEKTIETVAGHCTAKIGPPRVTDRDEGGVQLLVRGVQEPGERLGKIR